MKKNVRMTVTPRERKLILSMRKYIKRRKFRIHQAAKYIRIA